MIASNVIGLANSNEAIEIVVEPSRSNEFIDCYYGHWLKVESKKLNSFAYIFSAFVASKSENSEKFHLFYSRLTNAIVTSNVAALKKCMDSEIIYSSSFTTIGELKTNLDAVGVLKFSKAMLETIKAKTWEYGDKIRFSQREYGFEVGQKGKKPYLMNRHNSDHSEIIVDFWVDKGFSFALRIKEYSGFWKLIGIASNED